MVTKLPVAVINAFKLTNLLETRCLETGWIYCYPKCCCISTFYFKLNINFQTGHCGVKYFCLWKRSSSHYRSGSSAQQHLMPRLHRSIIEPISTAAALTTQYGLWIIACEEHEWTNCAGERRAAGPPVWTSGVIIEECSCSIRQAWDGQQIIEVMSLL